MSFKSKMFLNSLIGINYDINKCYFEIYDINDNTIKKEIMNETIIEKDNSNDEKSKSDIHSKIEAFCFDCKSNVNFSETPICKNHNVEYLNDLTKDINIESIEKNFKVAVENYEKMMKYIEEKINDFKIRNENQILLAKNIIKAYKENIDNLNYQIILNTKNILNFNDINYELLIKNDLPLNLEYNILTKFPVSNYLNERISIQKIQKNIEIKIDSENSINCVILFPNKNKLIFNIRDKIFLLNTKIYKIEDQIESGSKILFLNLMNDKETILISHENSIEKLIIENDKLRLDNYLTEDIYIYPPGIIINYKNEYAWTNGFNIGFIDNKYYNILDSSGEMVSICNSGGYEGMIINLFQFKNDILFTLYFCGYDHHMDSDEGIEFGSYNRKTKYNKFIHLERCSYKSSFDLQTDYKIFHLKNDEIIFFGLKNLYIIDVFNWKKKVIIQISEGIIMNSYYLNDSNYLLFFNDYSENFYGNYNFFSDEVEKINHKKGNDIAILKLNGKSHEFINENLVNLNGRKIFYNSNGNSENYGLNQNIIAIAGNIIEFYCFVDVKKSFKIKNIKN